jgi:probable selenium-dependent hydroxylase accessory protein YqeC
VTIEEAFSLGEREVISLVGAGGKTALMFALGNELSAKRKGILLTTTTKIWEPATSPSLGIFLSDQLSAMKKWVAEDLDSFGYLLVAQERLTNGKLQGIAPEWVEELRSLTGVSMIIVEADGAAGRSLKAPREGEPVLPQNTTLLIPVVGIDVLGCPLDERYVFRSEIATKLLGIPLGSLVTEEMIARLLEEIIRNQPEKTRVTPFINKVDLPGALKKARRLAAHLLERGGAKFEKVVLGQAQHSPAVKEIILC